MKFLIASGFTEFGLFKQQDKLSEKIKQWLWDNAYEYNTDTIEEAIEDFSKRFNINGGLQDYGKLPIIVRSEDNTEHCYYVGTTVSYWSKEIK